MTCVIASTTPSILAIFSEFGNFGVELLNCCVYGVGVFNAVYPVSEEFSLAPTGQTIIRETPHAILDIVNTL